MVVNTNALLTHIPLLNTFKLWEPLMKLQRISDLWWFLRGVIISQNYDNFQKCLVTLRNNWIFVLVCLFEDLYWNNIQNDEEHLAILSPEYFRETWRFMKCIMYIDESNWTLSIYSYNIYNEQNGLRDKKLLWILGILYYLMLIYFSYVENQV